MYLLSFLFTLHVSLPAYVNSTFLTKFISEKYVGLLYTLSSVLTIYLLSKSTSLLKNFGNRRLIIYLLLLNLISLLLLISFNGPLLIGVSFISILTTNTLISLCIDIFIEHFGNPKTIGKTRGIYLTITNLAWMLSPLITSLLIGKKEIYTNVYLVSSIAVFVMTIGLVLSIKRFKDRTYKRTPTIETYRFLKNNKHILSITIINFMLQLFFAWMVVYTPIYLHQHLGMDWSNIGVAFTIMLSPFVIFGLPIGILIDRYHVSKRTLLYIGFIIMIFSTISISFITSINVAIWSIILFLTRTGASIIETTSEIYFFTHTKEEDANLLGVFRDMLPIAYAVGPFLGTVVFMILPFKYLFLTLGIILMAGFYYIPQLKHNHG